MRILFYGDSNTYGFDPRGYGGGRYPRGVRWTGRLAAAEPGWEIINRGLNGRQVPDIRRTSVRQQVEAMLRAELPLDVMAVMLGTNDLLLTGDPDAAETVDRMEALLTFLQEEFPEMALLLIAPPLLFRGPDEVWDPAFPPAQFRRWQAESESLNEGYRQLAERLGIRFCDSGDWGIAMGFDLVHFSEAGHAEFARRIAEELKKALEY
ncbi:MAG: hypothetical protein K5707_02670 [Clostridia bacterium]|nr:hypothetical protein [Clostridia bacterium]